MKERRYKIVRMDQDLLVNIFNWYLDMPHCIALPISEHLPEGSRVVAVNYSPSYRSVDLTVEHESFSIVEGGLMCPVVPDWMSEYRIVRFRDVGLDVAEEPEIKLVIPTAEERRQIVEVSE